MELDIDTRFANRIISIEDILDAIQDQPTFATFHSKWMLFVDDLNFAVDADVLSLETISKAHSLAHRVSEVVQTFLDLEILSKKLISSLTLEVSSILDEPAELSTSRSSSPSEISPPPSISPQDVGAHLPSYVRLAYDWLLAHLHNPYPSIDIRDSIAKDTGFARKDIDAWFIDARKRIGWNALRKKHFSNKRANIVDAAIQVFIEEDPKNPIEANIRFEFLTMESRANNLYSEKFAESDLALKLNMSVKDMTLEMKAQAKAEERRQRLLEEEHQRAISSYPSPNRSASHSPLPSVNLYDDDLEDTAFQSISQSGRKRRSSSLELCDSDSGADRSTKRARIDTPYNNGASNSIGLPSPAASVHDTLAPSDDAVPSAIIPVHVSSRKRRLSDADSQGVPKRPRNLHVAPRSQAVSDPTPFSISPSASEFDGWFHKHFDNTPKVGSGSSTSLEVELYDVLKFNDQNHITQYHHNGLSPTTELADVQSFNLDLSACPFNYDELFPSNNDSQDPIAYDVRQSDEDSPTPYNLPSTLGLDIFTNFFGYCDAPVQPMHFDDRTLIVDTSSPVSNNPAENLEWVFPSFISMSAPATFDSDNKFQEILNIYPQDLRTLDPSIATYPLETPQSRNYFPPSQISAQHDRAAKQQKLREIKETAWRLEAELAATAC